MLSSVKFLVVGLVSDAGGANSGLHKLLRKGKMIPTPTNSTAILSNEYVTFCHPCFLDMSVAFWFCSTHSLKSNRNQLMNSIVYEKSLTKHFLAQIILNLLVGIH